MLSALIPNPITNNNSDSSDHRGYLLKSHASPRPVVTRPYASPSPAVQPTPAPDYLPAPLQPRSESPFQLRDYRPQLGLLPEAFLESQPATLAPTLISFLLRTALRFPMEYWNEVLPPRCRLSRQDLTPPRPRCTECLTTRTRTRTG